MLPICAWGLGPFCEARITRWSPGPQRRVSLSLSNHPLSPVPPPRVVPPCGQNFDWSDFVQVSPDAVTDVCSRQTAMPHLEFSILQHLPPSISSYILSAHCFVLFPVTWWGEVNTDTEATAELSWLLIFGTWAT